MFLKWANNKCKHLSNSLYSGKGSTYHRNWKGGNILRRRIVHRTKPTADRKGGECARVTEGNNWACKITGTVHASELRGKEFHRKV